MTRPVVLVIGGVDPSGGAGLAADIQTLTALAAHPAPVASVVTAQDTRGLARSEPLAAELVAAQARAVFTDMAVAAVKLGALGSAAIGRAVAGLLAGFGGPVVTDPVLGAAGGGALAEPELLEVYRETLLPRSRIATPNRSEFEALGGEPALAGWLAHGLAACLVTGGDDTGPRVHHVLYTARQRREIDAGVRLAGSFHGSGCTLASAIAARLAHGDGIEEAVAGAERFVRRALDRAFAPGRGQEIPGRW